MTARRLDIDAFADPAARLWNLEYPEFLTTPDIVKFDCGRHGDAFLQPWIIEDSGETLATILAVDQEEKQPIETLTLETSIHPGREADLLEPIRELFAQIIAEAKPTKTQLYVRDNMPVRTAAFKEWGYELAQSIPVTVLQVQAFDPTPFEPLVHQLQSEGIQLTTVAELEQEGWDWLPSMYESTAEMIADLPGGDARNTVPIERYREMLKNKDVYDYALMFLAMEGQRVVGYSRIQTLKAMPTKATTGLTGVVRSHRRRGIATALKVMGIEALKARGFEQVQTDNDATNPMLQLNIDLGYRPAWEWQKLARKEAR